jgi:hypothetical protein
MCFCTRAPLKNIWWTVVALNVFQEYTGPYGLPRPHPRTVAAGAQVVCKTLRSHDRRRGHPWVNTQGLRYGTVYGARFRGLILALRDHLPDGYGTGVYDAAWSEVDAAWGVLVFYNNSPGRTQDEMVDLCNKTLADVGEW